MSRSSNDKRKIVSVDVSIRSTPVVLTDDMARDLIVKASFIGLADRCPCREERGCGDFPVGLGCLYLGEGARGIVAKGVAREVEATEALEHVRKSHEMGLVHMVLWTSEELRSLGPDAARALELCACCPCCCISRRTGGSAKAYVDGIVGMGISRLEGECILCGECADACPFQAITVFDEGLAINADRCKGCGRCTTICGQNALEVYPLEVVPSYADGWRMVPAASYLDEILKIIR